MAPPPVAWAAMVDDLQNAWKGAGTMVDAAETQCPSLSDRIAQAGGRLIGYDLQCRNSSRPVLL